MLVEYKRSLALFSVIDGNPSWTIQKSTEPSGGSKAAPWAIITVMDPAPLRSIHSSGSIALKSPLRIVFLSILISTMWSSLSCEFPGTFIVRGGGLQLQAHHDCREPNGCLAYCQSCYTMSLHSNRDDLRNLAILYSVSIQASSRSWRPWVSPSIHILQSYWSLPQLPVPLLG